MTDPWNWTEPDLLRLIADQESESHRLDYKGSAALAKTDLAKKEISKDVSAFANSGGGVIVYGIIENGHIPGQIDSGFDPAVITREWLEQVIDSRIQRRIPNVRIAQISLSKSSPGRVAYVVAIPESLYAPHMASDHRFYKRLEFESIPMEEYEVRDLLRRESDRQREAERERDRTPYVTLEGMGAEGVPGGIGIRACVHITGHGVATNLGLNLSRIDDGGEHQVTSQVIRHSQADEDREIVFACPPDFLNIDPRLVVVTGFFTNMSNNVIRFRQSGRIADRVLAMTSAPEYQWPWD